MPDISHYIPIGVTIELHAKFQAAERMHKQQIKDAHLTGLVYPLEMDASKQAEQYYNETYKTQAQ